MSKKYISKRVRLPKKLWDEAELSGDVSEFVENSINTCNSASELLSKARQTSIKELGTKGLLKLLSDICYKIVEWDDLKE